MTRHHRSASRLAAFVGLVGALLLTGLAVPAHAALAKPTGLTVSAGEVPVFTWKRVAGATSYKVQVVDDDTEKVLVSETTTNRYFVPSRRVASGSSLVWQVQAVARTTRSIWSSYTVRTLTNPAPKLTSPRDQEVLPQPAKPALLQWEPVPGAEEYIVEVSRDAEFVRPTKYTTRSTAYIVPDTQATVQYWWRVTADLGSGLRSRTSNPFTYTIGRLSEVTGTVIDDWDDETPDANVEDVVFDWEPVPGAVTYELWVSSDEDFNKTGATVAQIDGIKGTRYSPPTTYDNDQYYWKVRAVNARRETVDWAKVNHQVFKREWPTEPQSVYPAPGEVVGDPFFYQWAPVQHASHYELQVGPDRNFSPTTFATCRTASTTFTPTAGSCSAAPGRTLYWRVRGVDAPAGVLGLWSEIKSFVYRPDRIEQRSPTPGATVAVPTLSWAPARNAHKYHVKVYDDRGREADSVTTYALSWTPNLRAGSYTWSVVYRDTSGTASPEYPAEPFTVEGSPSTSGRLPLTPVTGTAEEPGSPRFPLLSWEPLDGAAYYKVSIGEHGTGSYFSPDYDGFLRKEFTWPAATDAGTAFLREGRFDWFVTAHGSDDRVMGRGPIATFHITSPANVSGQRIALSGTALNDGRGCTAFLGTEGGDDRCSNVLGTPVLEWDPVPGASFYMVYLSRDRSLTNLVYKTVPTTTNTRWTPTILPYHNPSALPDSQAGEAYHWVIRPCVTSAHCAADPSGRADSAQHVFDKRSPAPRDLRIEQEDDITFFWEDYEQTNRHSTNQTTQEPSYQSAQQYRIQVSTTGSFAGSDVIDTAVVDQPTYTPFKRTYPVGPLFWRVQAIDAADNGLAWSQVHSLTKTSSVSTLEDFSQAVSVLEPLRWTPADSAKNYEVEVYSHSKYATATCDALSPAKRFLAETTAQTAFVTKKAFAADSAYVWRVRRIDVDGHPGDWSACKTFTTSARVPKPVAPQGGTYVPAQDPLFRWSTVPDGSRYRFELRNSSGSVTSTTTAYNAWAPVKALKDGRYDWRVVALDAYRGTLGASVWTRVTVDSSAPRVSIAAPAAKATPRSSFTARFSEPVSGVTARTFTITRQGTTTALPAKVTVSRDGKMASLKTHATLQKRAKYTLRVSSSIKDAAGNRLIAKTWTVKVS